MRVATLLLACAVCLGGCAGSSISGSTNLNSGAGDPSSASYNDTIGNSAVAATSFAPTAASAHTALAASEAADKLTAVATPGNAAYKIGPLDVLDISVFKVPDLAKTVQVAEDGTINYPLLGTVQAAGKTAHQIEGDITQKLGTKYLRDPHVTVLVKEYNSQRVTVEGAVKTSGVYSIKGNTSLTQVMAMAGDIDTTVYSGNVVVFRMIDGARTAAKFDIDAIRSGKAEDPQMEPGDIVVVDSSDTKIALKNVLMALPIASTAAILAPK
ncbi:MAG TPA: polysaccharide biosynthesis/export family protein [Xanthobacteraceae bacterium]|nr:polysaccharide biosynthesis/export family protein [Xanthobacteraceae bacterium]